MIDSAATWIAYYVAIGFLFATYWVIVTERVDRKETSLTKLSAWLVIATLWAPWAIFWGYTAVRDARTIRRLSAKHSELRRAVEALDAEREKIAERLEHVVAEMASQESCANEGDLQPILEELNINETNYQRSALEDVEWSIRRIDKDYPLEQREAVGSVMLPFRRLFYRSDEPTVQFKVPLTRYFGIPEEPSRLPSYSADLRFQRIRPDDAKRKEDWSTYFSSSFKKDVASLDRKLQGRVMNAIMEIAEHPTEPRGDTVKPLTGQLAGQWRYRLGDYRMVYLPKSDSFVIVFLRCAARGDVYH